MKTIIFIILSICLLQVSAEFSQFSKVAALLQKQEFDVQQSGILAKLNSSFTASCTSVKTLKVGDACTTGSSSLVCPEHAQCDKSTKKCVVYTSKLNATCTTNSDCTEGASIVGQQVYECFNNKCLYPSLYGGDNCVSNAQCLSKNCTSGKCIISARGEKCTDETSCNFEVDFCHTVHKNCTKRLPVGATCVSDKECEGYLACNATSKVCYTVVDGPKVNENCNEGKCGSGLTCYDDNVCRAPAVRNEGENCLFGNNCKKGFGCKGGKCAKQADVACGILKIDSIPTVASSACWSGNCNCTGTSVCADKDAVVEQCQGPLQIALANCVRTNCPSVHVPSGPSFYVNPDRCGFKCRQLYVDAACCTAKIQGVTLDQPYPWYTEKCPAPGVPSMSVSGTPGTSGKVSSSVTVKSSFAMALIALVFAYLF